VVSSNVVKYLKAKITLIKTATMYRRDLDADWSEGDEPQNWELSDHKVVIIELKSGCQLKIRKFVSSESYKLAPFLSSVNKQLQFTKEANKPGADMDSTDKASRGELDAKLKRSTTSFTLTGDIQDVFDEKARVEVDKRCELIREECARGETPITKKSHGG
jgi:hypothetical protein